MSNTINSNGKNVGTVTGSEAEYELYRESKGTVRPSTYNSADSYPLAGGDRVRSLTYPLNGGNNHYVRFFVNLNEESRLVKSKQVGVEGNADLSDQNRSFRNQTSQDAINAVGTVGGAYVGFQAGTVAGKAAGAALKSLFKNKVSAGVVGGTAIVGACLMAGHLVLEFGDCVELIDCEQIAVLG